MLVAVAAVALAAFQIAGVGWGVFVEYFRYVLPSLASKGQYPYYNLSVLGFFQRFASASPDVHQVPSMSSAATVGRWVLTLGLLGAAAFLTRGAAAHASRKQFDAEYSLVLATALLVTPTLWLAGLAPLWPGYAVALDRVRGPRDFLLAAGLGLSLALIDVCLLQYYGSSELPWALLSAGMLGTSLLRTILAREISAHRREPRVDAGLRKRSCAEM